MASPHEFEYKDLIEAIYRIVGATDRKFEALRATDTEAVRLAHMELMRRLEGFPQQFATKTELQQAATTLQRLEKDAVSRELYDEAHQRVVDMTIKLDREKLSEAVFNTFLDNYRIEMERAAAERRSVAEVLANATESVRSQLQSERNLFVTNDTYDAQREALIGQVSGVERWQYKLVGGLVFATFIAPLVTGVLVYVFTKQGVLH